jgi:hypothetical protein
MSGLYMPVKPVPRHVTRQGMWPDKTYGQARHVARQDMWPTLTDRLKKTLAFYRTTVKPYKKFMNIPLASGNCTPLKIPGMLKDIYIVYLGGMPPLNL